MENYKYYFRGIIIIKLRIIVQIYIFKDVIEKSKKLFYALNVIESIIHCILHKFKIFNKIRLRKNPQ